MKSSEGIVHGGGWHKRETMGRPKARFFGFLSAVWLIASLVGVGLFWDGWPRTFGYLEWCGSVLLGLQVVWPLVALVLWRTERPRAIVSYDSPPGPARDKL